MNLNTFDATYHGLLQDVLENGRFKMDRTGVGCYSVFGRQVRYDLSKGFFPLITTKFVSLKTIVRELLWFLSGDTNNNSLRFHGVHIWDEWAYEDTPEVTAKKYAWLMENAPAHSVSAKTIRDSIVGARYDAKAQQQREASGIDSLYRDAGGPEISPENGDLGPVYGAMWRAWPGETIGMKNVEAINRDSASIHMRGEPIYAKIDQIQILIDGLKNNPFSRRHIVSGWNPALLPDETKSHRENIENGKQVLPPCHTMFQFFVEELTYMERQQWAEQNLGEIGLGMRGCHSDMIMEKCDQYGVPKLRLSCQLYQRSCDIFLGAPYNIASYALLLMMVAQATGMAVGEFVHSFGDLHLYQNHVDQVKLQLTRESKELPIIKLNQEVKDIFAFQPEDVIVQFYDSHPAIKGAVAV